MFQVSSNSKKGIDCSTGIKTCIIYSQKKKKDGKMQANFLTLLKQQLRKTSAHHLHTAAVKGKTPVTESVHSTRL